MQVCTSLQTDNHASTPSHFNKSQSVRPFDLIGDNGYNSTYHNTPDIVANKFRWCDYATETTIALDNDAQ